MEWPKRTRTADWENGVLTLDGEKKFDIPKLTAEIMERLAGYTLVGFHVKGYPVTDELLAPLPGIKAWSTSAWKTAPSPTPVSRFSPCQAAHPAADRERRDRRQRPVRPARL